MKTESRWWTVEDDKIRCLLCPHACLLSPGESGLCGVREASSDGIVLPGYGIISAEAVDPVEKKPLYHFHPGEDIWSVGFTGCNMNCPFCQNHRISRAGPTSGSYKKPAQVVQDALRSGSRLLAFTYSEPSVHFEYIMDTAGEAHAAGLKLVLVSNGNLNLKPAKELLSAMDAVNIDLKSWNQAYYREVLGGDLKTVRNFVEEAMSRCWVELTTLIVPGDNDCEEDVRDMTGWISTLSEDIPLHLSAYHPAYRYSRPSTTAGIMNRMKAAAGDKLNFVYIGNLGFENDTLCPACGTTVVSRKYYSTESRLISGKCPECGKLIPGVFPDISRKDQAQI